MPDEHLPEGWSWLSIAAVALGVFSGLVTALAWCISKLWILAQKFTIWTSEHETLKTAREAVLTRLIDVEDRVEALEHAIKSSERFSLKRALGAAEQDELIARKKRGER